jgi:tetratricopeptide (TPR) repeat protein
MSLLVYWVRSVTACVVASMAGLAVMLVCVNSFAQSTPLEEFQTLYQSGSYRAALVPGSKALSLNPHDNDLRLKLANTMAWTGRYDAAVVQYERLLNDQNFEARARVGLSNMLRWRGAPQVALPMLQQAAKQDPQNKDVVEGLKQTQRELRPLTSVKLARSADSNNLSRLDLSASQRFWPQATTLGRPVKLELGVLTGTDALGGTSLRHRDLFLSIGVSQMGRGQRAATDWGSSAGARLELSAQNDIRTRVFGRAHADFLGDAFSMRVGHVNWGRQAFSLTALQAGLTANQIGMSGNLNSEWLLVKARLDSYAVSDGNRILDGEVTINPTWQPLPMGVQWYNAYAYRSSDRVDSRYWSPKNNLTSTLGFKRSWYFEEGEFTASAGKSFGLTNEARGGYSVAANGKIWIARDTSLGVELFAIDAPRVGAYRYNYLGFTLNQLW